MIKLIHPTARSSHVCCHPARPPDHLPVSYYLADATLSASPSVVRLPLRSLAVAALVAIHCPLRRSPASSASSIDRPFAGSRSLLRFPPRLACDRCPLFPRSHVDVSGGHLSTCCLIKLAAGSSLDRFRMKSAHRVLHTSVTVEINFFWF